MISVPPVQPVPPKNTFSIFQKGQRSSVILKPPVPFPTSIKWKEGSSGPLGSCFRSLPPRDKCLSQSYVVNKPPCRFLCFGETCGKSFSSSWKAFSSLCRKTFLWVLISICTIEKQFEDFIPRREAAKAAPKGSNPSFHFIGVGNGTGGFKITLLRWPFWNLENVLFDGTGGTGWTEIKWVLYFFSF